MREKAKVGILGLGKYLPEKVLTNKDLERMVDTTDEWITTRTGIKERRIARDDEATSDMAAAAANDALKNAKLKAEDIDLIIIATITPDTFFPSTACVVQGKLRARQVPAFDIGAACSGFIYAIEAASQFVRAGTAKYALVVGAEKLSAITDWSDRTTCILFGDGAGAAILGTVEEGGILTTNLGADGTKNDLLMRPAGGSRIPPSEESLAKRLHYVKMNGSELFKHAVRIMSKAALDTLRPLGLKPEEIDLIIPHQANVRILQAVAKRIGVSPKRIHFNIEKYGNMSAASSAVALVEAAEEGRIKKGDKILLDAFGAGLTWGAIVIEW